MQRFIVEPTQGFIIGFLVGLIWLFASNSFDEKIKKVKGEHHEN